MASDVNSIQHFREQLGLSQADLGQRVGVTRQTIAAWEKGERDVSVIQLARIARSLQVPIELLIRREPDQEPTMLFRADDPGILSRDLRSLLTERSEDYASIERLAGELPVLPESRPMEGYESHLVETIAREVRDWLGVEDAPLGDVLALLETKGLKVLSFTLPTGVSGLSAYTDDWGGIIVVNGRHPLERQYFTCLHELAHIIFHRREYNFPTEKVKRRGDPREKAANHFAAAVLLPREVMESELHGFALNWIPEPVLIDMKLRYGVSMRTVLFRAGDLGLISKRQAGQQVGILNKHYGVENEPVQLPLPERRPQGRLERLTFRALVRERLTASRAAEVLARPLMDIREQLTQYVTNPATGGSQP